MHQVDPYQVEIVDAVATKIGEGIKRIVMQLPTGAGKSVCFAYMCNRYLTAKPNEDILILVHREELLHQARRTLFEWYNIIAEEVVPLTKKARVYVGMVETVNNRLKKNPDYFRNVGLIIVDEAHIGNHKKTYQYFSEKTIIGVTATNISASKKDPMKNHFDTIVCGVDIPFLIDYHDRNPSRGLVPCVTYAPPNIDRSKLHMKAGDFDQAEMSAEYSKGKHVLNTVKKYQEHALGKKTLVFNCSINHSVLVNQAFIDAGYNSRHLDSTMESEERAGILKWFKNTPGAILNNVGILTTGFDEPSVECVIPNKSTASLPLWLQMNGRGARPYPGKKYFVCIDMGGNATVHLEWSEPRDWAHHFYYPNEPKKKDAGVAPIKICPACDSIVPQQARVCKHCGHEMPVPPPTYDQILGDFILITKNIDVRKLVEQKPEGHNAYTVLHQIKNEIINGAPKTKTLSDENAYALLGAYQDRVQDWCKETGKKYNQFHRTLPTEWFMSALLEKFNWSPPKLQL